MPPEPPAAAPSFGPIPPHEQDRIRIRHMLDSALRARRFCAGKRLEDLQRDELLLLATVKSIEVIGEACRNVSEELKASTPAIPWRPIRQMRNRMIHGYDTINVAIVWDTVQIDLPPLIEALSAALAEWAGASGDR